MLLCGETTGWVLVGVAEAALLGGGAERAAAAVVLLDGGGLAWMLSM